MKIVIQLSRIESTNALSGRTRAETHRGIKRRINAMVCGQIM
jgi:hypothetical protein